MSARGWRGAVVAAVLYGVATVALTWPLFRHPGTTVLETQSLYGSAWILVQRDINLTMWVLAWDAHALATDPLHLFDANAFFPSKLTLACSEHMLGNLPLFGPVYLLTRNPILGHQLALLASFVLAGLAMAAYVLYWTGDRGAALAGGFLFAFAPYRFWQIGNLHVVSLQYLPLVLLAIDAVLDGIRPRAAGATLVAALVLSTLCSYYVGYAAFVAAAVYALAGLAARGRDGLARVAPLLVCAAIAAAFLALLTLPYLLLARSGALPDYVEQGFSGFAFLAMFKFGVAGLLGWFVLPKHEGIPQFLTWGALACAAVALIGHRGRPRGALLALTVTGLVLALGPSAPLPWSPGTLVDLPYAWLARVVPGFSAMRAPLRFGALVTLGVAALAGLGIATVRIRLRAAGWRRAATLLPAVVVAIVLVEATPRGLRTLPMEVGAGMPPAVHWLAAHGEGGALLNLPTHRYDLYRESRYMYYSTAHWLPMVNGYSSYPPRSFLAVTAAADRLPEPAALTEILGQVPLRWVLFDRHGVAPANRAAWEATLAGQLRPAGDFGDAVLYEVPH